MIQVKRTMRFFTFLFISTTLLLASCDALKSKTKETINQGGEIAGEAASEFVEGFSDGIDESFDQKIILSDELKKKGIEFGAFSIKNGAEGIDNLLSIYLIFNQDFTHTISSKAFNESDVEIGRSRYLFLTQIFMLLS